MYVPLQLVTENNSGARLAFYGKTMFLPAGSSLDAMPVRLVWAVQGLVDICESYELGDTNFDGQTDYSSDCQAYSAYNQPQVLPEQEREQGRAGAVAGRVGDRERDVTSVDADHVEEIATDDVSRHVHRLDATTRKRGQALRQQ